MTRAVLALALLTLVGCGGEAPGDGPPAAEAPAAEAPTYTVRGVYLGPAYDGQAATVRHEAVPGFMPSMQMELRVADPAALDALQPGDKIRFRLVSPDGIAYVMTDIERLPPETALELGAAPDRTVKPDTASGAR